MTSQRVTDAVAAIRARREDQTAPDHVQSIAATALAARLEPFARGQQRALAQLSERVALCLADLTLEATAPLASLAVVGPRGESREFIHGLAEVIYGSRSRVVSAEVDHLENPVAFGHFAAACEHAVGEGREANAAMLTSRPGAVLALEFGRGMQSGGAQVVRSMLEAGAVRPGASRSIPIASWIVALVGPEMNPPRSIGMAPIVAQSADRSLQIPPQFAEAVDAVFWLDEFDDSSARQVAASHLDSCLSGLTGRGWSLELDRQSRDTLIDAGVRSDNPAPLSRRVEAELGRGLVGLQPGAYRSASNGSNVQWEPVLVPSERHEGS